MTPTKNSLPLNKISDLRYGENPHQKASVFSLGNNDVQKFRAKISLTITLMI